MALIKFRKLFIDEWEALVDKDKNTRYTIFDIDDKIIGEYIGSEPVINEELDDKVQEHEVAISSLEGDLNDLTDRVGASETDIGDLDEKVDTNVAALKNRISVAEQDIDKIEDGTTIVEKALRDSLGNVIKNHYVASVIPTYNDTNNSIYLNPYNGDEGLMASRVEGVALPKATSLKDGLLAKEDKVKINNIASDISNKLDKVWSNVVSQTMLNLTDEFVLNRGNQVYKTTLSTLLGSLIPTDIFIVVIELPEEGQPNKIYLLPKEGEEPQNGFDEYIWIDEDWEKLGSVDIDLSNYYTKTETENLLEQNKDVFWAEYGVTTYEEINDAYNANKAIFFFHESANNYNMLYRLLYKNLQNGWFYFLGMNSNVRHAYVILSVNNVWGEPIFTNYETIGNKATTISSASTDNQYSSAKAVYTLGESKVDKNANITGATKTKITYDSKGLVTAGDDLGESDIPPLAPSKITQDTNNRFVTDTEKSTWNGKQNALTPGDGISISGNVISVDGVNLDAYYTKSEIDSMIGDIDSALNAILGV